MLRFDMSEYMEKHSVSRLIGAPPGYVGFDQGGLLTDGVDQHPHCVLLLDEMEKAHPDVYNVLLQVMDNGKLTDHAGKTTDFRNAIIIMTSNAGATEMEKNAIGFGRGQREGEDMAAVEKMFSPEFRNRLDAVIPFGRLPKEVVLKVVEKFVLQLEGQLADRNVSFELTTPAAAWLADKGYDEKMGARPLGRGGQAGQAGSHYPASRPTKDRQEKDASVGGELKESPALIMRGFFLGAPRWFKKPFANRQAQHGTAARPV